jgi:hypothetical protein
MRWKLPKQNEQRIVCKFAILPTRIGDERVWFEFYYVRQEYEIVHGFYKWKTMWCTDKDEYILWKMNYKKGK